MKTLIKKIIITAVALLWVSVGVSFAHDGDRKHPKHRDRDRGHYQKGYDDHHGRHNKHYTPPKHIYRHYKKWQGHHKRWHHSIDRHHYRWHKKHYKRWHHYRNKHHYRKGHRVNHHRYHYDDHRAPNKGTIMGLKFKEPGFKFVVVIKDHK
jgi:hypothetical protein